MVGKSCWVTQYFALKTTRVGNCTREAIAQTPTQKLAPNLSEKRRISKNYVDRPNGCPDIFILEAEMGGHGTRLLYPEPVETIFIDFGQEENMAIGRKDVPRACSWSQNRHGLLNGKGTPSCPPRRHGYPLVTDPRIPPPQSGRSGSPMKFAVKMAIEIHVCRRGYINRVWCRALELIFIPAGRIRERSRHVPCQH